MARATFLRLSNGSRGLQGLQALTPRYWPPLGAFIKLPALRVVHDLQPPLISIPYKNLSVEISGIRVTAHLARAAS